MMSKNKKEKNLGFFIKRIFDIIASLITLFVLIPIFVMLGILIKLDSKGPIFFIQKRVGKDGEIFKMYKLRTMVANTENSGLGYSLSKNDSRITKIGKHLRWGIDELPQVINVLKGEMSLVGPRSTLICYVKQYSAWEKRRLEMKPGITSLPLIKGRNKLSWPEKIELDIWYVDHWSLWLDIKILFKTIWVVIFTREGVYGKNGVNTGYPEDK